MKIRKASKKQSKKNKKAEPPVKSIDQLWTFERHLEENFPHLSHKTIYIDNRAKSSKGPVICNTFCDKKKEFFNALPATEKELLEHFELFEDYEEAQRAQEKRIKKPPCGKCEPDNPNKMSKYRYVYEMCKSLVRDPTLKQKDCSGTVGKDTQYSSRIFNALIPDKFRKFRNFAEDLRLSYDFPKAWKLTCN